MTPSSWTSDYVGLPYSAGDGECAQRAALVWRERFGIDVAVKPAFGDLRRAQALIHAQLAGGAWEPVTHAEEGDAVLMRKGNLVCHVGVWVTPGRVLHCTKARGTVVTAVDDLPAEGFHLVGVFRRTVPEHTALPMAA